MFLISHGSFATIIANIMNSFFYGNYDFVTG